MYRGGARRREGGEHHRPPIFSALKRASGKEKTGRKSPHTNSQFRVRRDSELNLVGVLAEDRGGTARRYERVFACALRRAMPRARCCAEASRTRSHCGATARRPRAARTRGFERSPKPPLRRRRRALGAGVGRAPYLAVPAMRHAPRMHRCPLTLYVRALPVRRHRGGGAGGGESEGSVLFHVPRLGTRGHGQRTCRDRLALGLH